MSVRFDRRRRFIKGNTLFLRLCAVGIVQENLDFIIIRLFLNVLLYVLAYSRRNFAKLQEDGRQKIREYRDFYEKRPNCVEQLGPKW